MRHIVLYTLLATLTLWVSGCSSKAEQQARGMLDDATTLVAAEAWEEALELLDSLHRTFPEEAEVRRSAFELSKAIRDQMSLRDSTEVAPKLEQLETKAEVLYQEFELIEAPYGMTDENMLRYHGYDPSQNPASPFLDCYLAYDGTLQMVAGLSAPSEVGSVGIRVATSAEGAYVMSDTIPHDGGRNYRYSYLSRYYERLTLSPEATMRIGAFVESVPDTEGLTISFLVEKGQLTHAFQLNSTARKAITMSYRYALLLQELAEMDRVLQRHDKRKALREMEAMKQALPTTE